MNRYTKILIPETFRYATHNPCEATDLLGLSTITIDRIDRTARLENADGIEIDLELLVRRLLIELAANSDYIFNRGTLRRAAFDLYHALGGKHERV